MHGTKLPLQTWLMAMYLIISSSKGISSVVLARWLGVNQKTAWKVGHAVRAMMTVHADAVGMLTGIVELDEKISWWQTTIPAWSNAPQGQRNQEGLCPRVSEPKRTGSDRSDRQ